MTKLFAIESAVHPERHHDLLVRLLYGPIIGPLAVNLYGVLSDCYTLNKRQTAAFDTFNTLITTLGIKQFELEQLLRKLEAVGLLRTFVASDECHYLFVLNEPLSAFAFKQNKFLSARTKGAIGEENYERLIFALTERALERTEFAEVSAKWHEVFTQPITNKELPTNNLLPKLINKDDALTILKPHEYAQFLTSESPAPGLFALFTRLASTPLAFAAINAISLYVYEKNGRLVKAYIEKIADDCLTRSQTNYEQVKRSLDKARLALSRTEEWAETPPASQVPIAVVSQAATEPEASGTEAKGNLMEWDEIFAALGGNL